MELAVFGNMETVELLAIAGILGVPLSVGLIALVVFVFMMRRNQYR